MVSPRGTPRGGGSHDAASLTGADARSTIDALMSESSFPPLRVAFLGFSDFERTSLATCFRLAAEREPRYELVYTLTDADLLVADADHSPSVQLVVVTERVGETVFIGSQAPEGAASSLRRPIDALHVMRTLDLLARASGRAPPPTVATRAPKLAPSVRADPPAAADPEHGVIVQSMLHMPAPALALASTATPTPAQPAAPWQQGTKETKVRQEWTGKLPKNKPSPEPASRRPPSRSALATPRRVPVPHVALGSAPPADFIGPPAPSRALLVDDSAIALRFLASRLAVWSLRIDAVGTSGEALQHLAKQAYDFIFLDLELGPASDLDGLALCRHIKRNELAVHASVVMVSAHHSEIDRARGSLAGCDAYLSKPLKETELFTLLRRQGLVPPEGAVVRAPSSAGVWPVLSV